MACARPVCWGFLLGDIKDQTDTKCLFMWRGVDVDAFLSFFLSFFLYELDTLFSSPHPQLDMSE